MSEAAGPRELVVDTSFPTLEAFEAGFGPRVGPASLFCGVSKAPKLGTRLHLILRLADKATVALAVVGFVAWRYPSMSVPPGREAGLGLVVESVDEPYRPRFGHLAAEPLARAYQIPGTRLARRLEGAARARGSEESVARKLPPTARPLPKKAEAPKILGTAFVVASRTREVKHIERVAWPDVGTKRESTYGEWDEDDDTLTGDVAFDPFAQAAGFDDPWHPPPEERTDPRRISQVVEQALGATRLAGLTDSIVDEDSIDEPTPSPDA